MSATATGRNESPHLEVEVWFDIVCPFCYIGKRRMERMARLSGHAVRMVYRAYQLAPDAARQTDLDLNTLLGQRYGLSQAEAVQANARVAELGRQYRLHFDFSAAKWANSLDAHRLVKLATRFGREDALLDLLYSAFFAEGLAIGDRETLTTLAARAGLADDAIARLFAGEEFLDEIAEDRELAMRLGVHGVPTFRIRNRILRSEEVTAEALVRLAGA